MKTNKINIIIISTLSLLLIISIIVSIAISNNYDKKISQLHLENFDYLTQINDLNYQKNIFEQNYNALKNEIDQKNAVRNRMLATSINQQPILYYKTMIELDLKTEMTADCAVITTIPAGAKVEVLNSFFGRIWEVEYKGNKGWVNAQGTLEKM